MANDRNIRAIESDVPALFPRGLLNWGGLVLFVLISIIIYMINTRHGIGIMSDTTRYMGINDRPYDAPVYPFLLRLLVWSGFTLEGGAKFFGFIIVGANTAIIWHLLWRATGKIAYVAIGTALIILAPQFVTLHSVAMSEAPFVFLLLLTALTLLWYLETESRQWLVACAVALGLAALTRFTAPPMGAAVALCLLVFPRFNFSRRVMDAILFGAVSGAIFFVWTAISQITAGHSIGRELRFHGNMGTKEWLTSLEALTAWILPDQIPFSLRTIIFLAVFLAIAALTVAHARRTIFQPQGTRIVEAMLPTLFALFFVFYLMFMVLATSIEANLALNGRYAFPIYVTTFMLATIVLASTPVRAGLFKWVQVGLIAFGVIVLASHIARTAVRSQSDYQNGIGYAGLDWMQSTTMLALKELPADAEIYSNGADAIAYVLKRKAHFIPQHLELRTGIEDPALPFETELQNMRTALEAQVSYVVFFDNVDWRFYLATEAELKERLGLVLVKATPDGRIYEMPKAAQ